MTKTKVDIKIGDIVKIADLEDYREAGDEITELVKMFAGQYCKVINIDEEVNEWGEKSYMLLNESKGFVSVTDHEIVELYKKVEL